MRLTARRVTVVLATVSLVLTGTITGPALGASDGSSVADDVGARADVAPAVSNGPASEPPLSWQPGVLLGQGLEPVVRVDAQGRSHALWRSWDFARNDGQLFYAYRDATSSSWSKPVSITTTDAQRLSGATFDLAVSDDGDLAVIWPSSPGFSSVGSPYLSWSTDRGKSWSTPQRLESTSATEGVTWVAARFDGDGRLTAAWVTGEADLDGAFRLRVSSPTAPGATVVSHVLDRDFSFAFETTLAVADGGRAALAWGGNGDVYVRTRASDGTWTAGTVISPEGWGFSMVGTPTPVFLPDGSVVVAWQGLQSYIEESPGLNGVVISRWDAGTRTWSRQVIHDIGRNESFDFEPQLVSNGNRVALLAVSPDSDAGDAVLLWRSEDGGRTWGPGLTVARTAAGNPRTVLADDGAMVIAWLEEGPRVAARTMTWGGPLSARTVIASSTHTRPLKGFFPKEVGPSIALGAGGRAVFAWSSNFEVYARTFARGLTAAIPVIRGTAKVGKTLTAEPGTWEAGVTLGYEWFAGGTKIAGATSRTLVLKAAQRGKRITVRVTGSKSGYEPRAVVSVASKAVALGTLKRSRPKIAGKVRVGTKLTAKRGAWTAGTTFTYRWFAGGTKIKGATKRTFVLKAAQRGKRITVKVTGRKAGYAKKVTTSAKTMRVR